MKRLSQTLLLLLSVLGVLQAESALIDCRLIVGGMRQCNPYSSKLIRAKEIGYRQSKKRLIVDKTLPVPQRKSHIKVVSVEEMIERYVKVEPPKRYQGTETKYLRKHLKPKAPAKKVLKPSPQPEQKTQAVVAEVKRVQPTAPEPIEANGTYIVQRGDTLSKIALMFGLKTDALMKMNELKEKDHLRIGKKLTLPLSQEMVDTIAAAKYRVQEGDTLLSIAKKFNLDPKALAAYNKIDNSMQIRQGKVLKLPLPYALAAEKAKKKKNLAKRRKSRLIRGFGKHKLRVTATAYTSHGNQTDSTPFLAAWNNRLRPGMKVIAVSRDLLSKYGMRNGTKVRIGGLPGIYRVRDKMNKRYKKRIDIYMGTNRRKALRWGRRSVVIYW